MHGSDRWGAGKLLSLVAHLRAHPDELEADFQQYYGLDLGGLYTGALNPWRAARLANLLPPDSRSRRAGNVNDVWMTRTEQLLTVLANATQILVWHQTKDGQKGTNPPEMMKLPEQLLGEAEAFEKNTARAKALARRIRERQEQVG